MQINSKRKGAKGERDKKGRFKPNKNIFIKKDNLIYCYSNKNELLFFTDNEKIIKYNWCKYSNVYCATKIKGKIIPVHRFLINPKENEVVDHINRNKKDNRMSNLRNTNKSINAFNTDIRINNHSGYTGVYYRNDTKKWTAEIKKDYKKIVLGCYEKIEDAIKARKNAEEEYYNVN